MEPIKIAKKAKEYWESVGPPMAFKDAPKTYEEKRAFRFNLQDYMRDVFDFERFSGKRVLDIGCGTGIDSLEFARNGAEVFSIDFTESSIKTTEELFKEAGLKGDVLQADATKLPFEDNFFDCVYSFGVLHHIPEVEKALQEIHRVLKPNGTVMVMLYNKDSLLISHMLYFKGIKQGLLQKMTIDEIVSTFSERIEGNPYTKAYTKDEAGELFSKFFSDVKIQVKYNVIDTDRQRKVKLNIPDEFELGWHLIIKARK